MKKILSMITLTVLMVALAGSCTKNIEERIDKTDAEVASLQAAIGQYEKLQSDITSVLQALRAEVGTRPASEQQSVWNCINTLQNQSNAFESALKALQKLVGETSVDSQIEEAVENIISAYNLDELASTLKSLDEEIAKKFDVKSLEKQVDQITKTVREIDYYLARINAFYGLLQSVTIIPQYEDGSIKAAKEGVTTFSCAVTPVEVLAGVSAAKLKDAFTLNLFSAEAKTKAGGSVEIHVTSAKVTDSEHGIVEITANLSRYLSESDDEALMLSLNVKLGASNYSTGYVKVTIPVPPIHPIPEGAFTVNADGKKVYFSQGNLQATYNSTTSSYTWGFAANQYDCIGNAAGNTTIDSQTDGAVVDLFGWSTERTDYGISTSFSNEEGSDDYSGEFVDWGKAIGDGSTWRTLSKDEWQYLINKDNNENIRKGKYKSGVTVCSKKNCLVLAPDDFTGEIATSYDAAAWESAKAVGLVCLPAAGQRQGSDLFYVGDACNYWSSTASNESTACYVLSSDSSILYFNDFRCYGFSVRLVTDVE